MSQLERTIYVFIFTRKSKYGHRQSMHADLCGSRKKKRFLPEKVLKIVDCRECGGLLAKPICTATVYFHNFTIPEY